MGIHVEWGGAGSTAHLAEHGEEIGSDVVDLDAALYFDLDGGNGAVIEANREQLHAFVDDQRAALDSALDEAERPVRDLDALSDVIGARKLGADTREAIALGVLLATAPSQQEAYRRFLPEEDDLDRARQEMSAPDDAGHDLDTALAFIENWRGRPS